MKNRTPIPRGQRAPLPAFTPVPRKARHDGWTPERQKAFIEALADTGSVSRACAMVNMTSVGAYYLRRQPQADEFRRAWEAALDYGVARMKELAFERATEGTLVPVITGGKLIGWRRIYNDRLLMFCLRHYGEDPNGKRTTVNYFSTRATAGAAANTSPGRGGGPSNEDSMVEGPSAASALAQASASTAVVRTTIAHSAGPKDLADSLGATARALDSFDGVALDDRAQAEIRAVLEACAARQRSIAGTPDDEAEPFIAALQPPRDVLVHDEGYGKPRKERRRPPPAYDLAVEREHLLDATPHLFVPADEQHRSGEAEVSWEMLGDEQGMAAIESAVQSIEQAKLEGPTNEAHPVPQVGGAKPSPPLPRAGSKSEAAPGARRSAETGGGPLPDKKEL